MNLRAVRKAAGYTQKKLAEKMGVSRTTVTMWENGTDCGIENAQRIARILDVPVESLFTGAPHVSPGAVRVPIYGIIPAGIPMEAIEDVIDFEEIPATWTRGGKEYFGLRIRGDSMSPKYSDGDVVIFRKQDTCESGQDCAVMVNSEDATFKRVRIERRGLILQPINPEYETYIYDNEQIAALPVRILGVAVRRITDV